MLNRLDDKDYKIGTRAYILEQFIKNEDFNYDDSIFNFGYTFLPVQIVAKITVEDSRDILYRVQYEGKGSKLTIEKPPHELGLIADDQQMQSYLMMQSLHRRLLALESVK